MRMSSSETNDDNLISAGNNVVFNQKLFIELFHVEWILGLNSVLPDLQDFCAISGICDFPLKIYQEEKGLSLILLDSLFNENYSKKIFLELR